MSNLKIYNYLLSDSFKEKIKQEEVKEIKNIMNVIRLSVYLASLTGLKEINIPLSYVNILFSNSKEKDTYELSKSYSIFTVKYKLIEDRVSFSRSQVLCKDEQGYLIFKDTIGIKKYMDNFYESMEILKEEEKIKYKDEENKISIKRRGTTKEEIRENIMKDILKSNDVVKSIIYKNYLESENVQDLPKNVNKDTNDNKKKMKI